MADTLRVMVVSETIAVLVSIIDRTASYLRESGSRKNRSFEKDVQPLFEAMLQIHEDYRTAFTEILESWSCTDSRDELVELLRGRKWKLQPLRDATDALLSEFLARAGDSDFGTFYEDCRYYFSSTESTTFTTLINYVLHEEDAFVSGRSSFVTSGDAIIEMELGHCERHWKVIAQKYARLKAQH